METHQPTLPGFDDELLDINDQGEREPAPKGELGALVAGRVASAEALDEPDSKAFPVDELGRLVIDEIQPGMVDRKWGIVIGKYTGPVEFDIVHSPRKVPAAQRPIAAVRHYAKLVNARASAFHNGDVDRITELDRKIADWLKWTADPPVGRPMRKTIEDM